MRPRRAMSQINVVPYIDVMLVLLVIFMVAAPMLPTGTVELPSVGQTAAPTAKTPPLVVTVRADGTLTVNDSAGNEKPRPVSRTELAQAIADVQAKDENKPVVIAGDKAVRYDDVLKVMDELKRQDVKRIGLLVQSTGR